MEIWIDIKTLPIESDTYEVKGYNSHGIHSTRYACFDAENLKFFVSDFIITHWRAV